MIDFSTDQKQIRICIPVSSLKDMNRYHKSLINILDRIEIDDCNPDFRDDLINVYELLSHLKAGVRKLKKVSIKKRNKVGYKL